jgi:hypothetical protein
MEKFKDFVKFVCEQAATPGGHLVGLWLAVHAALLATFLHIPKAEDLILMAFTAWVLKLKDS